MKVYESAIKIYFKSSRDVHMVTNINMYVNVCMFVTISPVMYVNTENILSMYT